MKWFWKWLNSTSKKKAKFTLPKTGKARQALKNIRFVRISLSQIIMMPHSKARLSTGSQTVRFDHSHYHCIFHWVGKTVLEVFQPRATTSLISLFSPNELSFCCKIINEISLNFKQNLRFSYNLLAFPSIYRFRTKGSLIQMNRQIFCGLLETTTFVFLFVADTLGTKWCFAQSKSTDTLVVVTDTTGHRCSFKKARGF